MVARTAFGLILILTASGTVVEFNEEKNVYTVRTDDGRITQRAPEMVGLFDRLDVRRRGHHAWRRVPKGSVPKGRQCQLSPEGDSSPT